MRATTLATAAVALLLLPGCMGGTTTTSTTTTTSPVPPATPSNRTLQEHFGGSALPAGWTSDAGMWAIVANSSAPSAPTVLQGTGGGARSTLRSDVAYLDFEATVHFLMVSGDEGAGLSFRYAPDGDYRIVRYSPREAGWHYFVMKGAESDKRNEATVYPTESAPRHGEWVTLKVRAEGRHVQAWHGDALVIDFTEAQDPEAGAVGPFLRGAATALFDDLSVKPL